MSKQEEIREGIREGIKTLFAIETSADGLDGNRFATYLLKYLHSQGVVIKDRRYGMGMDTRGGYNWKDIFFVIPLIKEESDGDNDVP